MIVTGSNSNRIRKRPLIALMAAVIGMTAAGMDLARGQVAQPGPAERSAAIVRLLQERASSSSELSRAAAELHAALVRAQVLASSVELNGLGIDKPGSQGIDAAPVEAGLRRKLILELDTARFALGAILEIQRDRPNAPRGAFRDVEQALDLGAELRDGRLHGQGAVESVLIGRIARELEKALGTFTRQPSRPHRVIRTPIPEVRRNPVPLTGFSSSSALTTIPVPMVVTEGAGAVVTPEITALAALLNNDPLRIYQHVRNNFKFETYFGCLKGAQATLETGGGNDYDLAALTGSLLQAAGFNVRYGRGTAIIPSQDMIDWLGLEDESAANSILNTAGINAVPVVSGPSIIHYRVDRFWAEVETSLRPGSAPIWFPLDTAFKRHDLDPGIPGLLAGVPFDDATYLSIPRTELTYEFYRQQIRDYLTATLPGTTVDEVPLGMTVVPETLGSLPRSLPYQLFSLDNIYTVIPTTLTHKATVRLQYLGFNHISHQLVLPDDALKRVTMSYTVDPADQSIVDGFGGLANTPAGVVDVRAELKLDGVVVAQSGFIPYLDLVTIETDFFKPEGTVFDGTSVHTVRAGEWAAIGIDAYQISETHLQRQVKSVVDATTLEASGGTADPDDLIGAFLYLAIMQYHQEVRDGGQVANDLAHFRQVVQVSEGAALANQELFSIGGTPFTSLPGNMVVDVPRLNRSSFALDDDNTLRPELRRITGFNGSAQEHGIWESFLNVPAVSTIKSIQVANQSGIPVFAIDDFDADPLNDCSVLCPQLTLSSFTEANIAADVASGRRVTVPRDPTSLNDWNGVGYITEDPLTGAAGYIISGGLSSASSESGSGLPPAVNEGGAVAVVLEDGTILIIPVGLLGDAQGASLTGDPVNISSGNFFRDETDFSMSALSEPLSFQRYYNSQSTFDGGLGLGWMHQYGDTINPQPDLSVIWIDGHGTAYTFQPDIAPGTFISPPGLRETLVDTGSGHTLTRFDGRVQSFDITGKLASRTDRNGNARSFTYDIFDRLATVADPASRALTFVYNAADKISTVTDFTGRVWTYTYDGNDQLASVTSPSDAQTPAMVTQYTYESAGRLATVTEPNGGVRQITYYANGRVAQVINPLGDAMTLVYNAFKSETNVTSERGMTEVHQYNSSGNTVSVTHADGSRDSWVFVENRITSHTDPLGSTETFEYDPVGNVTRNLDATLRETRYEYEVAFSNLMKIIRPVGRETVFAYDGAGNVNAVTDPEMGAQSMFNDAQGLPTSVTDARGVTTTFTYNTAGQVATESKPLSFSRVLGYTPRGFLASLTDSNSNSTIRTYDLLDRLVSIVDADSNADLRVYDAAGRLASFTNAGGGVTQNFYDLNNRLIGQINPDGSQRSMQYNPVGNVVVEIDELGRTTTHAYDARNRLIRTVLPDGGVQHRAYDAAGRIIETRDPLGNATQMAYDAAGRLVQSTDALGQSTQRTYDASGDLETVADRRGGVSAFEYDGAGRISRVDGEAGRLETFDYDGGGKELERTRYDITSVTVPPDPRTLPDGIKRRSIKSYDLLGRVETETNPEGGVTSFTYDSEGNVLTVTDPRTNVTTYEYTKRNQISKIIRPDLGEVQITYDAMGNRKTLVSATGGVHRWTYDGSNRVSTQEDPLGSVTRYEYDPAGNLTKLNNPDGSWVRRLFDPANRLRRIERSDGTWSDRTYDAAGNLARAATERTTLTYTYDVLNRMLTETLDITGTGFAKTVSYQWDEESNLEGVTDPTGRSLTYLYDLASQLTDINSTTLGNAVQIGRDGYGQRATLTYANGTSATLAFDKNGRPMNIDWGASVAQLGYVRDAAGSPTGITELLGGNAESLAIVYDAMNRATSSTAGIAPLQRSETFSFDLNGNATNPGTGATTVFNLANQAVSDGTFSYFFDQQGNRSEAVPMAGSSIETKHDPENRVTEISQGSSRTLLTYDALDRVVQIDADGVITRIVHALQNRLAEFDAASNPTALYTMSTRLDDVFSIEAGANTYYAHTDAIGSVRAVTSAAGAVVGTRAFGLFGRAQGTTGTPDLLPLGFGARPSYLGGSLIDLRARLYDPTLATFLSVDPLGVLSKFPNPYAYASNRPLMFVDPLGLTPQGPTLTNRLFGALRLVGGLAESALGIAGILAPEPLTTAGGVLLTGHGVDSMQAGLRQLWSGEATRSLTSEGLGAGAELLGASESTAYYVGEFGDAGIGIVLTLGTSAGLQSARVTQTVVQHGPLNPGPLADDIVNTFRSGTYAADTLGQPTTLYRVIGEGGNPAGSFWTATRPSGPVQSIIDLALDPQWGNTATSVIRAEIPAGTTIYSGAAAAQRGLVGGGSQVFIPRVNPAWIQP